MQYTLAGSLDQAILPEKKVPLRNPDLRKQATTLGGDR